MYSTDLSYTTTTVEVLASGAPFTSVGRVAPLADDREDVAPFDRVSGLVGKPVTQAVLARPRGIELLRGIALLVGRQVPVADRGLDRLAVFVVGDVKQPQFPLPRDGL